MRGLMWLGCRPSSQGARGVGTLTGLGTQARSGLPFTLLTSHHAEW